MKTFKKLSLLLILAMLFVAVVPASAQLGETDFSSFTVQNVDTETATVTIHFYEEDGDVLTPSYLNEIGGGVYQTNPFDLEPGESWEVYLPSIRDTDLPDGRYSVVIESSAKIVTIANLIGSGDINFNGSYSGFDGGSTTFQLPAINFNFYGWYSLVSVQNVGTAAADVLLTITCNDGTTGELEALDVPINASYHFDLEEVIPDGFAADTKCNGSGVVTSDQPVVAVDNQTVPTGGYTQSYSGVISGAETIFVPALYHGYYTWNSSINIRKLDAGDTTVTIAYDDGDADSTCDLTDETPNCMLYMPDYHPSTGYFGATITSDPAMEIVAVVNAATDPGTQAQTYNGIGVGSNSVGIPSVMVWYYNWFSSFTCQNVGTVPTDLHIAYDGFADDEYDTDVLAQGESIEVVSTNEDFLPDGHQGGATVTANEAGALITCIANFNNVYMMENTAGDWSMSYNAFPK